MIHDSYILIYSVLYSIRKDAADHYRKDLFTCKLGQVKGYVKLSQGRDDTDRKERKPETHPVGRYSINLDWESPVNSRNKIQSPRVLT